MLAVETKGLSKCFADLKAVDSLDLNIIEGETYGLLGPNGSGKTTTIKMLTGLLKPNSGEAHILGQKLPSRNIREKVGYMPQETAIYLENTVEENLTFFGELYCMPKKDIPGRITEILDFVELSDRRDALACTLSGGMQHRLSLACSLLHSPKILFLDEPTVGVDPELRASFWEFFRKLGKQGTTVIITTHYMDEASHCSKVGLMRNGHLIAEDVPQKLMDDTGTTSLEDAFLKLARRDAQ